MSKIPALAISLPNSTFEGTSLIPSDAGSSDFILTTADSVSDNLASRSALATLSEST